MARHQLLSGLSAPELRAAELRAARVGPRGEPSPRGGPAAAVAARWCLPIDRRPCPHRPALDAASLGLDARCFSAAERRQAYRAASLRWHPDRFLQAFGNALCDDEREVIMQRVTQVSQAVNSHVQETPL